MSVSRSGVALLTVAIAFAAPCGDDRSALDAPSPEFGPLPAVTDGLDPKPHPLTDDVDLEPVQHPSELVQSVNTSSTDSLITSANDAAQCVFPDGPMYDFDDATEPLLAITDWWRIIELDLGEHDVDGLVGTLPVYAAFPATVERDGSVTNEPIFIHTSMLPAVKAAETQSGVEVWLARSPAPVEDPEFNPVGWWPEFYALVGESGVAFPGHCGFESYQSGYFIRHFGDAAAEVFEAGIGLNGDALEKAWKARAEPSASEPEPAQLVPGLTGDAGDSDGLED